MKKSIIVGITFLALGGSVFAQDLGSSETEKARKEVLSSIRSARGGSFDKVFKEARSLAKDDAKFAAEIFRELREDKKRYSKEDYIKLYVELLLIAKSELSGAELENELKEFSKLISSFFGGSSSIVVRKRLRDILASVKKAGEKDLTKLKKRYASRVASTRSIARLSSVAESGGFSGSGGGGGFFFPGGNFGGNNGGGNNFGGNNFGGNNGTVSPDGS